MELDQTTFYSILGLSSNATPTEISKSYKNLARRLHPDKSKSTYSEDLFKLIVQAHSILTDEQKKLKYDRELMLTGLYGYNPNRNDQSATEKVDNKFGVTNYPRKSQPYESQPYGFGFDTTRTKHTANKDKESATKSTKTTKFTSFNVKSYKRAQRRRSDDPVGNSHNIDTDMNSSEPPNYSNNNNNNNNNNDNYDDNIQSDDLNMRMDSDMPIEEENPSSKEYTPSYESVESNPFMTEHNSNDNNVNEVKKERLFSEEDEGHEDEKSRSKIPKYTDDPIDPEHIVNKWDHIQRHHLRTRQKNKEYARRSSSPMKTSPVTNGYGVDVNWKDNLRDIITKMTNIDQDNHQFSATKRSEDIAFDLENINESLDSIPLPASKRSKTDEDEGFLHKPVNITLPRVYKKELLHEEESFVMPEILERQLPNPPNFHVDISNPLELDNCKKDVIRYNMECNDMKREILSTYMNRLMIDMKNNEKLTRIENTALWLKCRRFDTGLTNKIQEVEYKQSVVAHTFSNMISGLYPSDTM
ncbi:hypothetical protein MOSE0_J04566 [Monosporozyma servazzii]